MHTALFFDGRMEFKKCNFIKLFSLCLEMLALSYCGSWKGDYWGEDV